MVVIGALAASARGPGAWAWALLLGAGLAILIAVVTGMGAGCVRLWARATARRQEIAMRLSLGARAPIGTVIDIILTLPDGTRLHLPGKVAHLGPGESGDIGVRFDDLPEGTQQQIEGYVAELAAGRTPTSRTKSIPPGVLIKKKS